MQTNKSLKIILIITITFCAACLFAKSFLAIHTYPEYKGDGVNLMFKLNPLGENFVREDSYEKDMESALHIHKDEMMLIGQDTLECILKIPLPIYLFVLLLLISAYLKIETPALKKRRLIIPTIAVPIMVWIIWLYRSHSPSEKVYTSDKQYSYYLEKYNYNAIFQEIMSSWLYETEYKVFVYDEITGKKLYSGYAGGKTLLCDYFGFDEEENKFHLTKPDYIILPRPIREFDDERLTEEDEIQDTCADFERKEYVWDTEYADGNWYLIRGEKLNCGNNDINRLISAWNAAYPIQIKLSGAENTTATVNIVNDNNFTQSYGSTGAISVLSSLVYTLTEDYRYKSIRLHFKEGDHASPGIYTRADFTNTFQVCL